MRVICVAGARPNYMKVKPVMDALEEGAAEVVLVHTGQHYDAAMNDVFFADLGIRPAGSPAAASGSGSHAAQTGKVMAAFEPLVEQVRPDVVVVVGDVNSTLGCALVTAKSGALLAHVEAGLRSRDWAMPEEINRVVTDRVSDFLLAPSPDAVSNLRSRGIPGRPDPPGRQRHGGHACWRTCDRALARDALPARVSQAGRVRPGDPAPARQTWTTPGR